MRPAKIFPLLFLLATGSAAADMYKWTDANGITQYGQHPPAGVQAERLRPAPAPATAPAAKSLQQQVDDMNREIEASDKRKAEAAQKKQRAEIRKTNCANARRNIEFLGYGGNRRIKMPDGSYQTLDEKTRNEQLEKNRKAVKEFCD